jgi:hypothetical protein
MEIRKNKHQGPQTDNNQPTGATTKQQQETTKMKPKPSIKNWRYIFSWFLEGKRSPENVYHTVLMTLSNHQNSSINNTQFSIFTGVKIKLHL